MSLFKLIIPIKISRLFEIIKFSKHDISTIDGKSKERYRRIFLTGATMALVKILTSCVNLITVPLTLKYLGTERYGLWMTISSMLTLMSFADLGLGNGLLNAISKANGENNIEEAKKSVSSTFYFLLFISFLLFIIFLICNEFVNWGAFFNVKSELAIKESKSTVFALVVIFLINMPIGVVQRIYDGYQEGFRFQLWLIIGFLISFSLILICIKLQLGLMWLVLAYSSGQIIVTIINAFKLFLKDRKELRPTFQNFDLIVGKKLINSGFIFFLLGLFTLIGNSSDNIIIAQVVGPNSIPIYEIVKKMFLFSMFTQFIIQPLWPAFGEAIISQDYIWAQKTLKKAITTSLLANAIIALPLLIFGKQIVHLWVGKDYNPEWSLLFGFYFFVIFANYGGVMSTFLNSGTLLSKQLFMISSSSIFSIILKIYFTTKFGISGTIWSIVIAYSILYIFPSYKLAFKYFNEKISEQNKNNL